MRVQTLFTFLLVAAFLGLNLSSCTDSISVVVPSNEVPFTLYASSNTNNNLGIYRVTDPAQIDGTFYNIDYDADGIVFNKSVNSIFQINRTDNRIDVYTNIEDEKVNAKIDPTRSSESNIINGRGLTIQDNKLVAVQDANDANNQTDKLIVYDFTSINISTSRTYVVPMNLWDVEFVGDDLYAIQDNSDTLAVFYDFLAQTSDTLVPDKKVQIEGIVRTHSLAYVAAKDAMILTDVGAGSNPNDGAIGVIDLFTQKFNADRKIFAGEIHFVKGDKTLMGNPVDVQYDSENDRIYVAERAHQGGLILGFDFPTTTLNVSPSSIIEFEGASAIHLSFD